MLLPAPALPPPRADLRSGDDLSLTVIVEQHAHHSARRFGFHASRQTELSPDRPARGAPRSGQALLTDDRWNMSAAILDRDKVHDSVRFLAGAIAQARPGTVLHNPPYLEAATAYRRSDALGVRCSLPHLLSDTRV
jgi:hypothetical protein